MKKTLLFLFLIPVALLAAVSVGDVAPNVTGTTLSNQSFNSDDHKGTVILYYFFGYN